MLPHSLPLLASLATPAQAEVLRHAIIIGSNAPSDELVPLLYAEDDARRMAELLVELGGFDPQRITVLESPGADQLDAAIATHHALSATHAEDLFLFYYSGHADHVGLRLGGERYAYEALRQAIRDVPAEVRLGVLDACRSGEITRLKGLSLAQPFLGEEDLSAEGEAWLTAASADENAQESDQLQGSFFTHYLLSGLRGAADQGDGLVSLDEAYAYAYDRTVARTGRTVHGAQHPSYDYRIQGKGDLALTDVSRASARLRLPEDMAGVVTVLRVPDELPVAEVAKAAGSETVLGLPPGNYLLQLRSAGALFEARFGLSEGATIAVPAGAFRMPDGAVAMKGTAPAQDGAAQPDGATQAPEVPGWRRVRTRHDGSSERKPLVPRDIWDQARAGYERVVANGVRILREGDDGEAPAGGTPGEAGEVQPAGGASHAEDPAAGDAAAAPTTGAAAAEAPSAGAAAAVPSSTGAAAAVAPAVEAPAVEAPAVEAPAVEAPAVEAPVVEAPAAAVAPPAPTAAEALPPGDAVAMAGPPSPLPPALDVAPAEPALTSQAQIQRIDLRRSPAIGAAASYVLPGAGQLYNGQWVKGAVFLGSWAATTGGAFGVHAAAGEELADWGGMLWTGPTPMLMLAQGVRGWAAADAWQHHKQEERRPITGVTLSYGTMWNLDPQEAGAGAVTVGGLELAATGLSVDWIMEPGFSLGVDRSGYLRRPDGTVLVDTGARMSFALFERGPLRPALFLYGGLEIDTRAEATSALAGLAGGGANLRTYLTPRYFFELEGRLGMRDGDLVRSAGGGLGLHFGKPGQGRRSPRDEEPPDEG